MSTMPLHFKCLYTSENQLNTYQVFEYATVTINDHPLQPKKMLSNLKNAKERAFEAETRF